MSKDLGHTCPP